MLFKNTLYIEEELKNNASALAIIKKLKPQNIIYIKHYKDLLNQTGGDWDFQKKYQKLILAQRTDNFYYQGSNLTPHFGYDLFFYNTLAINCLFDCSYCYLQGMYNTPHLVIFINNNDFLDATEKLITKHPNKKIYLALSYDTDLPALETFYPFCQEWIEFARNHKNLTIEIRTKSNKIEFIKNKIPLENAVLAWSILPEQLIHLFEPATPNLASRITAINEALSCGWKVMLCIDPLIAVPGYENILEEFINKIKNEIELEKVYKISVGTFRMNSDYFKNIKKNKQFSCALYNYPYIKKNNAVEYPDDIKFKLINNLIEKLNLKNSNQLAIYE